MDRKIKGKNELRPCFLWATPRREQKSTKIERITWPLFLNRGYPVVIVRQVVPEQFTRFFAGTAPDFPCALTKELISSYYAYYTMFCPECKSMLISSGGQLKCRKCGYIRKIVDTDQKQMSRTVDRKEKTITIVDDEEEDLKTMPTIQIKCPKCDNNLAIWWLRQLRAADESEVRFFRCTKCDHTWRQYD